MKKLVKSMMGLVCMVIVLVGLVACGNKQKNDRAEESIDWQIITAEDTKKAIEAKKPHQIIDIQPKKDFAKGHLPDSISVSAYPVDSPELEKMVSESVPTFSEGNDPIYVLCPGGGSGAKRTISIMQEKGIDPKRLFIIENGAKKWPYDELWVTE